MTEGRSEQANLIRCVAVALAVTTLDGFDAMSLSLTAPMIARDVGIETASLGLLFSSQMVGMMAGAACGGYVADRLGRLPSLLGFMALFALAAITMPFMHEFALVAGNRFLAGLGFGAAAPIVVALVASTSLAGRSAFVISTIWAGLPAGGILAALYNYFLTPVFGWQSIFIAGGILPLLVAIPALAVFPREDARAAAGEARPGVWQAIGQAGGGRFAALALLFLFGYSAMSIIVYWLPTILTMRGGDPLLITAAFIGVNLGSAIGSSLLGYCSDRVGMRIMAPLAWLAAGCCLLALELPVLGPTAYIVFATAAATFTAGSIALLIVLASQLHPAYASTMIGLMVTVGRLGQVGALAATGVVAAAGVKGSGVFAVAGTAALVTAVIAVLTVSRRRTAAGLAEA